MTLTLGTLPDEKQAANDQNQREVPDSEVPKLGLTLAPSDKVSGADGNGVVVTAVAEGGVAADHGFQVGDVILDVGGKPVSTPADVRKGLDRRAYGGQAYRVVPGEVGRRHKIRRAAARQRLAHDREKGSPAFGKDHAQQNDRARFRFDGGLQGKGHPLASVAPAGGRPWGRVARPVPAEYQLCLPASVAPAGVE